MIQMNLYETETIICIYIIFFIFVIMKYATKNKVIYIFIQGFKSFVFFGKYTRVELWGLMVVLCFLICYLGWS